VSRYVVTVTTTVTGSGYADPDRTVVRGQVLELSSGEVTAIGAGNLRSVSSSTMHDQLGEAFAVSNGD